MNTSPGALLLLLLAIYLLLAFFTGRLEWLFRLGHDTATAYQSTPAAPSAPGAPGATAYPRRNPGTAVA